MAEIGEVIYSKLTGYAGLAALVGTRVYPIQLPQRPTLPAVTYQRISTLPIHTRDNAHASLERPRFQFDCWGSSYAGARAVAQEMRNALATFPQASNPRVDVALMQNEIDDYEPDIGRWRVILDAFIWHEEV
jgi:hypothetical protein